MITSEQQYQNTRAWLARFEQALADVDKPDRSLEPRARQALRDQYRSQIEELREALVQYEALDHRPESPADDPSTHQSEHAPSLAGVLTRLGLTLNDLAAYLRIPPSVALMLQRGRIDPRTIDQKLFTQLGTYLRLSVETATQLVAARPPAPRFAHARIAGEPSGEERPADVARQEAVDEDGLLSFRDALVNAPDLTDEHRRAWLEPAES